MCVQQCNRSNYYLKVNLCFYLRLATLELVLPIPMHFSRCGANLEAAKFREQFGHTHSTCLALIGTWPKMSNPLSITISVKKTNNNEEMLQIKTAIYMSIY